MLTAKSNRAVLKTGLVLSSSGILHQLDEEWDLDAFAELFTSSQNQYRTTDPQECQWKYGYISTEFSAVEITKPSA